MTPPSLMWKGNGKYESTLPSREGKWDKFIGGWLRVDMYI